MRRGLLLGLVVGLVNGGLAVATAWWLGHRRSSSFGWFAYSPMPRRYADYLPAPTQRPGWLVALGVIAMFAAVNAAGAAGWFALQRRRGAPG